MKVDRFFLSCIVALACIARPASAERADYDKPVNLEADRITVDDAKRVHIFEGNVQLTQGTLVIRCDKLVVTQDADGFQKAVASGGPNGLAHFRQKREDKPEYVEGEAEVIVHNAKTQITELFRRARVKSGQDEVRGQYISYDGKTENYVVSSGPDGTIAPPVSGKDTRVRAIIQPKKSADKTSPTGATTGTSPPKSAVDNSKKK
jgi:lipopolysaccharide export system protein LptA